jgi:hypothetical protein
MAVGGTTMYKPRVKAFAVDIDQTIAYTAICHHTGQYTISIRPGHPQGDVPTRDCSRVETSPCGCPGSLCNNLRLDPLPGAVVGIKSLQMLAHIRYYMMRSREVETFTKSWLSRQGFPNAHEVCLCRFPSDKVEKVLRNEALADPGNDGVVVVIDDSIHHFMGTARFAICRDASLGNALRRVVLVAFGFTADRLPVDKRGVFHAGVNLLALPSWDQEDVQTLKDHFYQDELLSV